LNNEETSFYNGFPELDVHIFEDSPVGIRGTMRAVDLLEMQGVTVRLTKWGISTDANKVSELQKLDANIVPDVNAALEQIEIIQ
jgi:hypothetical protein